jgi:hypothetical protein
VESLLGDTEVSSLKARVPVRKGLNFWSDHWISLKFLHEFPDAVFLGVDEESLLGDTKLSSLRTKVPVQRGHTFWSAVGSLSNFYRSFWTLFSL